ncbi:MAG: hypothetical protein Fur0043_19010 [Anaerolineales bacterium]
MLDGLARLDGQIQPTNSGFGNPRQQMAIRSSKYYAFCAARENCTAAQSQQGKSIEAFVKIRRDEWIRKG